MKKFFVVLGVAGFLLVSLSGAGLARELKSDVYPIQVSLFNPIQVFPEDIAISGLRLNFIYGVIGRWNSTIARYVVVLLTMSLPKNAKIELWQ